MAFSISASALWWTATVLKAGPEYIYEPQRRLDQGLSICIFPEGGVPEEHIVLDEFKDGAFKMAIAHKIPVVPITFYDNKKRFPFTFFNGGPGRVRAKVHCFFETGILAEDDKSTLREEVKGGDFKGIKLD